MSEWEIEWERDRKLYRAIHSRRFRLPLFLSAAIKVPYLRQLAFH